MRVVEWLDDLRHDRPAAYFAGASAFLLSLLLLVFLVLPPLPFLKAIGVIDLQSRVRAGGQAIYWGGRALAGTSAQEVPRLEFGTVAGHTKSGMVVLSVPRSEEFVNVEYPLANIEEGSLDMASLSRLVAPMRDRNAKAEVYQDGRAVIWVSGQPLNLVLIEAGGARPETNPLTNIVDRAFASYYWMAATGEQVAGGAPP